MGIRELRLSAGLTQKGLGDAMGIKRSTVAMWETGKSTPRTTALARLAELLHCSTGELLTDKATAPPPNG